MKNKKSNYFNLYTGLLTIITGMVMIFYFSESVIVDKFISIKDTYTETIDKRAFLKYFYDSFSFSDAIMLEGFLQICFLLAFAYLIKKTKTIYIVFLICFNAVLFAQFSIPSTFVTQVSPKKINTLIKESSSGYPIPSLKNSIAQNTQKEDSTNREFGCAAFYKKELVQVSEELNPSFTNSLKEFDENSSISSTVLQYPVCYFADTIALNKDSLQKFTGDKKVLFVLKNEQNFLQNNNTAIVKNIVIKQFSPWGITIETNTGEALPFVLFQNYNSNWKLQIDGNDTEIKKANLSFMYASVEKGQHLLEWKYKPRYINYAICVSLITLLCILFVCIKNRKTILSFPSLQ